MKRNEMYDEYDSSQTHSSDDDEPKKYVTIHHSC